MSYRGPQPGRIRQQVDSDIFRHAGQTATWRQYVSASAGVSVAGFGGSAYYREQRITGVFGDNQTPRFAEKQGAGGMIAAGEMMAVTREKLGKQDELTWRGVTYRVESDPTPSRLDGAWVTILKRGK